MYLIMFIIVIITNILTYKVTNYVRNSERSDFMNEMRKVLKLHKGHKISIESENEASVIINCDDCNIPLVKIIIEM